MIASNNAYGRAVVVNYHHTHRACCAHLLQGFEVSNAAGESRRGEAAFLYQKIQICFADRFNEVFGPVGRNSGAYSAFFFPSAPFDPPTAGSASG